jgi:predicted glycosyltransferase
MLGIPSAVIMDYEFAHLSVKPTWLIHPEIIPDKNFKFDSRRIFKYPGIKEDVYVPSFLPDSSIRGELGLDGKDLVITIRPPATEAHYHNAESEVLFKAVMDGFGGMDDVRMILLPRNKAQEIGIRHKWAEQVSKGRIIIPEHVIDGLNLMCYSDIVISGGGTMNREAAALGVPVYSIFRGKIGCVDKYLAEQGKLVLLESVKDVREKIKLVKRAPSREIRTEQNNTLNSIVNTLTSLVNTRR